MITEMFNNSPRLWPAIIMISIRGRHKRFRQSSNRARYLHTHTHLARLKMFVLFVDTHTY